MPTPEHIIEKQLYNLADRLERVEVDETEIAKYLPGVRKKLEWLSEEDLLKRVLSLEFNRLLKYYQNMPDIDLNAPEKGEKGKDKGRGEGRERNRDKDRRSAEDGFERLMVNVGKSQGFFPGNLMELVNRNVVGDKPDIGRIDLLPGYTLFDVRKQDARRVIDALKNVDFFGTTLHPEIATDRDYAREARDRSEKRRRKRDKEETQRPAKAAKGKKKAKKSDDDFFTADEFLTGDKTPVKKKKEKKEKKEKKAPKGKKVEYNGNYEIFYNKKKK